MMDKITIFAAWISTTPDRRQWKPSAPKFVPCATTQAQRLEDIAPLYVAVEIPAHEKYIYNLKEIEQNENTQPILTTLGFEYMRDELELAPQKPTYKDDDFDYGE